MARSRFSSIPPGLAQAIAGLPASDAAGRRTRAVARLLEAGLRPREIVEFDERDVQSAASLPNSGSSGILVPGRKPRFVQLEAAAAADVAAYREGRRADDGAIALSDVGDAVAAVSEKTGVTLRAHGFRILAALRVAAVTSDEDRRRIQDGLEGPGPQ